LYLYNLFFININKTINFGLLLFLKKRKRNKIKSTPSLLNTSYYNLYDSIMVLFVCNKYDITKALSYLIVLNPCNKNWRHNKENGKLFVYLEDYYGRIGSRRVPLNDEC